MSKINAVRLINLNYNNNAIRISDEVFHLNGESTLLSLRNGGGKSVLVQMIMAPFVHRRYRDAKDRSFESYFTTNKPTFILVEWVLDQGAGYALTGMMVRRSQDPERESSEELEIINIISEYKERCQQDIFHLPVVEKTKKEVALKNFAACRQLFETYKKDRSMHFNYYDMNNISQSRQYFEKLKEFQINYKEWETIIKKVNLKESGLSDLFADCKDEKGLVEKWFLDAVESKLNKDRNRMKEFQSILEKYVGQYKDNKSKIERRDTIRRFKEDASSIMERAVGYQESSLKEKEQEERIAGFSKCLETMEAEAREKAEEFLKEKEALQEEISFVEYEEISQQIHELADQERYHASSRDMFGMEREALDQECARIEEKLHLFACARQQLAVNENLMEYNTARERLEVSRQKGEDLEPERKSIGGILKRFYGQRLAEQYSQAKLLSTECGQARESIRREKEKTAEMQEQLMKLSSQLGALAAGKCAYDEKESFYNRKYEENLGRNILGEYEPGEMEIRLQEYGKQLESLRREKASGYRKAEQLEEQIRTLRRDLTDENEKKIHGENARDAAKKELASMEQELSERRIILRYLGEPESVLFDRESILSAADRKLDDIELVRRRLEKEEDELQKEYIRLTQGKVLELPEEFEALLSELGLHCVYGMEWLNRNGNSQEENRRLVEAHPFLPYALILSGAELDKLAACAGGVYTSFPIPIIVRESLENASGGENGSVIGFPGVSFYVLFNENLLDEEKLLLLVREKEEQLRKKKEAIAVKKTEYSEYCEKKEKIRNQKVTGELYEGTREKLLQIEEELRQAAAVIQQLSERAASAQEEKENLDKELRRLEKELSRQERRLEDYQELCDAYAGYLEELRREEKLKWDVERLEERKKLSQTLVEKLEEKVRTLETGQEGIRLVIREIQEKLSVYAEYEEAEGDKLSEEKGIGTEPGDTVPESETVMPGLGENKEDRIAWLEARFQAITSALSQELLFLEEQTSTARRRLERSQSELQELQEKYGLPSGSWQDIIYQKKEEDHQESLLEDRRKRRREKDLAWHEADKATDRVSQQIKDRRSIMVSRYHKEEPLARAEIRTIDFAARIRELAYQQKKKQNLAEEWDGKLRSYEENLSSLAEYSHFVCTQEIDWQCDFREMGRKQLRDFKGVLVRDYKQSIEERREQKECLERILNRVVRKEEYQEEFYRKPLESMLELTDNAQQVISQLNTTVLSYDRLMEKLEVDISMVEKEKAKIVELLEDYISDVHRNLGRIDHNSTITIRERSIKMLKIQLPDWEENESLYQVRLQDFIDGITEKGIEIFEKNENAQEYFGARMTTKNLYDTVVGIGNVQIRLYKIEEQREYPITWADVARNSGGEGFLSAFVILSSLLYYMRKDDSDIFADRNEGKVLVMDNPFAQTNAAHLLKPLMDMARKTNTQLICLSGLGGESIYNRFDNIYVLNLIAASLRNGMQYLKADHTRGSEAETMIVSQIEVMEQQELIF